MVFYRDGPDYYYAPFHGNLLAMEENGDPLIIICDTDYQKAVLWDATEVCSPPSWVLGMLGRAESDDYRIEEM